MVHRPFAESLIFSAREAKAQIFADVTTILEPASKFEEKFSPPTETTYARFFVVNAATEIAVFSSRMAPSPIAGHVEGVSKLVSVSRSGAPSIPLRAADIIGYGHWRPTLGPWS